MSQETHEVSNKIHSNHPTGFMNNLFGDGGDNQLKSIKKIIHNGKQKNNKLKLFLKN